MYAFRIECLSFTMMRYGKGAEEWDSMASIKSLIIVNDKCFIAIHILFIFTFRNYGSLFCMSVSASDMSLWIPNLIFCIILKCIWSEIDGSVISYSLNCRCRSSNNIKFVFDGNRIHCKMHQMNPIKWNASKDKMLLYIVLLHTSYINLCLYCPMFDVFNAQEAI